MENALVDNVILLADSYKSSHYKQYPPGATIVYSYFESRGGKFPYTLFFGLQYILKRWLVGKVVTREKIKEAKELLNLHFGTESVFNEEGWNYILEHHGGYLPIRIKAVAEGSVVPTHNVLFTVENTDPNLPWLTSFLETILVQTWYPSTVATLSRIQKQIIHKYLTDTHDDTNSIDFKLHDFGYRGVSSVESGAIGGASHLVNFRGSDTVAALSFLKKYYHCPIGGFSVPASEHSTITSWGQEGEVDAFENMIQAFSQSKIISIVVDSYDVYRACSDLIGVQLKDKILEYGKSGGVIAIRPDSGDPATVCLKILGLLGEAFGTDVNTKGYKVLPSFLRILQGDGISYTSINSILKDLKSHGWSAENIGFGSGGALLQRLDRDTQKFAYKCSHIMVNGKGRDVFKDPITDPGKKSKKGRLILNKVDGKYITCQQGSGDTSSDLLQPVFENGVLLKDFTLDEIRQKASIALEDDIMGVLF